MFFTGQIKEFWWSTSLPDFFLKEAFSCKIVLYMPYSLDKEGKAHPRYQKHHNLFDFGGYRGTAPMRKRTPLGPYRRPTPRVLGGSQGGGRFLMSEVPL